MLSIGALFPVINGKSALKLVLATSFRIPLDAAFMIILEFQFAVQTLGLVSGTKCL